MFTNLSFTISGFRCVYGALTAFAWLITFLFSLDYLKEDKKRWRYYLFNLLTLVATLGIFFAADFFTLFLFFEIMSFTSFMWVLHRETRESFYAAGTYLAIAIAGGLSILMGMLLVWRSLGTLCFHELYEKAMLIEDKTQLYIAACCMFAGFGAKAGAFPVHVWLPMSYREAPAPATALLSAILSKTGIFGLLCISATILPMDDQWGFFILVIGIITMVLGGICGLCSDNLKTTIAYSSMSQIGFILVGVGMQGLLAEENGLAVWGTMLHMVNHTFVKLLLFLLAGVIFAKAGGYELNHLKGFGKRKPFLQLCFILGAAGVGGIPLLNGYISKTLLHESIVEYQHMAGTGKAIESLFLFSGGLTLAYMTKLYVVLFVEKNENKELQKQYEHMTNYVSTGSRIALVLCAIPVLLIGLLPNHIGKWIMDSMSELMHVEQEMEQISYFSLTNLTGVLISVLVAVVMYLLVVKGLMLHKKEKGYHNPIPNWVSMEVYLYRDVMFRFIPFLLCVMARVLDCIVDSLVVILRKTVYRDRALPYELPEGNLFTHRLAQMVTVIHKAQERFAHKPKSNRNYEHEIALKNTELVEDMKIVERSLSFGLFMFCLGLTLTLIYLFAVN